MYHWESVYLQQMCKAVIFSHSVFCWFMLQNSNQKKKKKRKEKQQRIMPQSSISIHEIFAWFSWVIHDRSKYTNQLLWVLQPIAWQFNWPVRSITKRYKIDWRYNITLTLKMTTTQVVETSVTVTNSSFQNYTHPDNHTRQTTEYSSVQTIYYGSPQLACAVCICRETHLCNFILINKCCCCCCC